MPSHNAKGETTAPRVLLSRCSLLQPGCSRAWILALHTNPGLQVPRRCPNLPCRPQEQSLSHQQ